MLDPLCFDRHHHVYQSDTSRVLRSHEYPGVDFRTTGFIRRRMCLQNCLCNGVARYITQGCAPLHLVSIAQLFISPKRHYKDDGCNQYEGKYD